MYSHSHIHILQPARIDVRALSRAIIHTHTHTYYQHARAHNRSLSMFSVWDTAERCVWNSKGEKREIKQQTNKCARFIHRKS